MNSGSLHELIEHFDNKLEVIKQVVDLRDAAGEDRCQSMLTSIQSELHSLTAVLVLLRNEVGKQREQLNTAQTLKKSVTNLKCQLKYGLDNIPARLPRKQEQSPPIVLQEINAPANSNVNQAPSVQSVKTVHQPAVKPSSDFYVQQVDLLTVEDFNSVPKYMRGRLTYSHVNNTVDELNKAYKAKYKLLAQKRTKLSDPNRKKWEKFKSQENKESTGYYFIVDDDVKTCTSLKVDNTFRNTITVLRHCGRLKEIRGNGFTRYAVLLVY